jgi:hypothetical protein
MAEAEQKLRAFFSDLTEKMGGRLIFLENREISSVYDSERRLIICGQTPRDWVHEICHLAEREDAKAIGRDNWGFSMGTWDDFWRTFVVHTTAPWDREMRVWTWQVATLLHFGYSRKDALKEVLPEFVGGQKPMQLYRISKKNPKMSWDSIERTFAHQLILNRLKLRRWSWNHLCKELDRKLEMLRLYQMKK